MVRSRLSKLVPVLVVLLLLITACGESDDTASANETTPTEQSAAPTATAAGEATATHEPTQQATETATEVAENTGTPSSTEEWVEAIRTANPTNGTYKFLTFDEAQAMVDFTLVMPDPLPPSMEFGSAAIAPPPVQPPPPGTAMPTGEAAFGEPMMVDLVFRPTNGATQPVNVTESSMSGELGGGVGTIETITIEGVEVTKQTIERDTETTLSYMWDAQGLNFSMFMLLGPDLPLTAEDLEALIAGTIP